MRSPGGERPSAIGGVVFVRRKDTCAGERSGRAAILRRSPVSRRSPRRGPGAIRSQPRGRAASAVIHASDRAPDHAAVAVSVLGLKRAPTEPGLRAASQPHTRTTSRSTRSVSIRPAQAFEPPLPRIDHGLGAARNSHIRRNGAAGRDSHVCWMTKSTVITFSGSRRVRTLVSALTARAANGNSG
jgi:hypothetical protein